MAEQVKGADSTAEFTPLVTGLKEVDTSEVAKKITTKYEQRCLLYFFSKEKTEWITRGKGNIKIQKHEDAPFYQMVLYEEKTFKLRLCAMVPTKGELQANEGSDRSWTFACTDYSGKDEDEPGEEKKGVLQSCAIKFKNSEIANKFKAEFEKYQEENLKAASAKKGTEEAKKEEAEKDSK
mmetsp:Transcript_16213/g.19430  ORF Transcript_16213/g.19430 Transcript_16213/m.19430 type:complete len:180 (-) Transcript_16213:330-869(-)